MPELPEIECLKRTLEPILVGATVLDVRIYRSDIVRHDSARADGRGSAEAALLNGCQINQLIRHGKQLAIISDCGRVLCIHLGMSGQCWVYDPMDRNGATSRRAESAMSHIHCRWRISSPLGERELLFRDPRRFGGLWTFSSCKRLVSQRWSVLGPDALTITSAALRTRLAHTQRAVKVALLDQRVIAGIGNIYADETLFRARIHPRTSSRAISRAECTALARAIRATLRAAIKGGGSTLRDYRDGTGQAGRYQMRHAVYGRAGKPCRCCGALLIDQSIGQRTTVFCPDCQSLRPAGREVINSRS